MSPNKSPSEEERPNSEFRQTAISNVEAQNIWVGRIFQTIIYFGISVNSSQRRFAQFLSILVYIACLVWGGIKLINGEPELSTYAMLVLGSGLLSLTCIYYAWFWKPELRDQSPSDPNINSSNKLVKQQQTREQQRKWTRRSTMMGAIAIPLLTYGGFFIWQSLPPKHSIILLAEFEPDKGIPPYPRVTNTIEEQLGAAIRPYSDIKLKRLFHSFANHGEALAVGQQYKASIVIWGRYGEQDKGILPVSFNFEVLKEPKYLPKSVKAAENSGATLLLDIPPTKNLTVYTNLSSKTRYLTFLTLGVTRYSAEDWDGSINFSTDALKDLENPELQQSKLKVNDLDRSLVYAFRGKVHQFKENGEQALADYNRAIEISPNYSIFYGYRGSVYNMQGNHDLAISNMTKALNIEPKLRLWGDDILGAAYVMRGSNYLFKGDFTRALGDINQAIQLNATSSPNGLKIMVFAYRQRAVAYELLKNYAHADEDYTKSIEIAPKYMAYTSYVGRGRFYSTQQNFTRAIEDFNKA
ncbi:tetratricopeptide repeat protein [Phormidesmis priestleyi ULC007]|uniref:Tetratricopeptide repeat protein n=1 Tax=Phormidesmis priestleyi ULC007 TaxID=1920490 RepID=A0A2T1D2G7_9CYAN|nr:tetratricopeptide repeat protein [Phormidesmis priestleyi]PSB14670.1 tetratricopeptide repeat protein [Phormidesmis priestleyi ULC007]